MGRLRLITGEEESKHAMDRSTKPPTSAELLRRDLSLVKAHIHTIPVLLGLPSWHSKDKHLYNRQRSELDSRQYAHEQARIALGALVTAPIFAVGLLSLLFGLLVDSLGGGHKVLAKVLAGCQWVLQHASESAKVTPNARTVISVGQDNIQEVCYYVNGVVEQGRMIEANATLLEELTGRAFNLVINPSDGLWLDLLECMFGRTLDVACPVVKELADAVERQLVAEHRHVVIIAHSQGGIILSNTVRELLERSRAPGGVALAVAFRRLEVYSFCSAADEFDGKGEIFAEHFASEYDFVARIGVLHFSGKLAELENTKRPKEADEWNGEVFTLERKLPGQGHLFKEFLLPVLVKGPFGQGSRLYQKYFKASPEHQKITHTMVEGKKNKAEDA